MHVFVRYKSVKQMSKELGLNHETVAMYHKLIRNLLEKNHMGPSFDGDFEFETYIFVGSKEINKRSA